MACSKLEELANTARESMLSKNVYTPNSQYSSSHPNATQAGGGIDDPLNVKGKGTGITLDTTNGGSSIDVNGSPSIAVPTGRAALQGNEYNSNNIYSCFVSEGF
jgi:hypothetical protein